MGATPDDQVNDMNLASPGHFAIRALSLADAPACEAFFGRLDREDIRLRFAGPTIPLGYMPSCLARIKDGAAIAAVDSVGVIVGIADLDHVDPRIGEVALVVRSDRRRRGIGRALLAGMIHVARRRGLSVLAGLILIENRVMLTLARAMGFLCTARAGFLVEVRRSIA